MTEPETAPERAIAAAQCATEAASEMLRFAREGALSDAFAFAENTILDLATALKLAIAVETPHLQNPGPNCDVDKEGLDKTQWKRTAPDAKELDTTKVEDALFKMGGVDVSEFVDAPKPPSDYGLDAPLLKVTVKAKGESWIEVGKKGDEYFARRSGDDAILKLDKTKAEELVKAFSEL